MNYPGTKHICRALRELCSRKLIFKIVTSPSQYFTDSSSPMVISWDLKDMQKNNKIYLKKNRCLLFDWYRILVNILISSPIQKFSPIVSSPFISVRVTLNLERWVVSGRHTLRVLSSIQVLNERAVLRYGCQKGR